MPLSHVDPGTSLPAKTFLDTEVRLSNPAQSTVAKSAHTGFRMKARPQVAHKGPRVPESDPLAPMQLDYHMCTGTGLEERRLQQNCLEVRQFSGRWLSAPRVSEFAAS